MTGRNTSLTMGIPLSVGACYLFLAMAGDIGRHITSLVITTAFITVILSFSLFTGKKGNPRWSAVMILCTALMIRLFFLVSPPTLSDDMYRYYVDGRQTLSGHNPYIIPPSLIKTDDKTVQAVLPKVNHPDLSTIYPPSAQIVFALAAVTGNITGFKAVLVLMDLLVCLLIILLLEKTGSNRDRAVFYAWHPLPVLETASSGHIDTAALMFLFLALLFLERRTVRAKTLSGVMLALSGLVKLFPFVFLPAFFRLWKGKNRHAAVLSFSMTVVLLCLVFFPGIKHGISTLGLYMSDWEFSGFLFRSLRSAGLPPTLVRVILAVIFVLFVAVHGYRSLTFSTNGPVRTATGHFHAVAFA